MFEFKAFAGRSEKQGVLARVVADGETVYIDRNGDQFFYETREAYLADAQAKLKSVKGELKDAKKAAKKAATKATS